MKKSALFTFILFIGVAGLLSWGFKGHEAVGAIAENHLTSRANDSVKALLGDQTLAEVSTWADDVKNDPQYSKTAPWHYLDLPLGMNYQQFAKAVTEQNENNIYSALKRAVAVLAYSGSPREQKVMALKFIVHFVGDAHQPMHVSRTEDKGGNTIKVNFDNSETNLHALWDSKLIDKQGLSVAEMAKKYDHATPAEIKQWQADDVMKWLYESYEISTKLYSEVEKSNQLGDDYYAAHLPIVEKRIEQGGIRLAGVLNNAFSGDMPAPAPAPAPLVVLVAEEPSGTAENIDLKDVASHMNKNVIVSAKVFGYKDFGSLALLDMGAPNPDQLLTVVLRGKAKELAANLDKKWVTVTGKIVDYKGKPEIIVTDPAQIIQKTE